MVSRIDNDGASYAGYVKEAASLPHTSEEVSQKYISRNRVEAGVRGVALGGGEYLHEGVCKEAKPKALPKAISREAHPARYRDKSRLETPNSQREVTRRAIVEVQPSFNMLTGNAEMVVRYSDNTHRVVKTSNSQVLSWLKKNLAGSEVDSMLD